MIKKIIMAWMMTTLFLFTGVVAAHPPSDMRLTYDPQTGILLVEIKHISNNIREHHIRRLRVYKNQEEPISFTIVKQTSPSELIKEVPLKAAPGDTIRIAAFCKEGGVAEKTLVVEEKKPLESHSVGR